MNRRSVLTSTAALGIAQLIGVGGCATLTDTKRPLPKAGNSTRWIVLPAVGLDACFALTIAAADISVLQVKEHKHRREGLRALLGTDGVRAAERLMQTLTASGQGSTPGAALALVASAGEIGTLDQVVDTFSVDGILTNGFEGTSFFQSERAKLNLQRLRPVATAAFVALSKSGFEEVWRTVYKPKLNDASDRLAEELSYIDLVAQHRRYLTRPLDAEVTVYLSELSEPHGIKIVGQRFVTSPNYSTLVVRRNAVHEMIHPLFEPHRLESRRIVGRLANDPLINVILEKSDPAYGYSSVDGLIEEGVVQALEAVINERLEQGRDQGNYWREQDGGMHVFAAATYALMKSTSFATDGGDTLMWLDEQVATDMLQDAALQKLAASIIGPEAVFRWQQM